MVCRETDAEPLSVLTVTSKTRKTRSNFEALAHYTFKVFACNALDLACSIKLTNHARYSVATVLGEVELLVGRVRLHALAKQSTADHSTVVCVCVGTELVRFPFFP